MDQTCLDGSDLPRPTGGDNTLYIRATDSRGGITEKSILYTYNNTAPTYTMCGTDLLDENRSYYYLTENVTGPCSITATQATTTLKGNLVSTSTGYTVTGNIVGNGNHINLQNIIVTGTTNSNRGDILIQNSTTADIISSATSTGQSAGDIIIATSTTGSIYANGANGNGNGGHGGSVLIINSLGTPISSIITTTGGNSLSCGNGGNGGLVSIISSTYGTVTNNGGLSNTAGCPGSNFTPGSGGSTVNVGGGFIAPSSPASQNNSNSNNSNSTLISGTIDSFFVRNVQPVLFRDTQRFNLFNNTNRTGSTNVGNTILPSIFQNLATLNSVQFTKIPTNFLTNVTRFVLNRDNNPEIFTIRLNGKLINSTIKHNKKDNTITQSISVKTNQKLDIRKNTKDETLGGIYNNQKITFYKGNVSITTPSRPGVYYLKADDASNALFIEAKEPVKSKTGGIIKWIKGLFNR